MSFSIKWVGPPNSWAKGRPRPPQYVTLHHTAGSEGPSSAENGANYDKTRTDGTSCHYFTDSAGPALQLVKDEDTAYSALYHGNMIGIHVEICGTSGLIRSATRRCRPRPRSWRTCARRTDSRSSD